MQNRALAVNVFDEGNSSSQTNQGTASPQNTQTTQPAQNETNKQQASQEPTFDKKPLVSTSTAPEDGPNLLVTAGPWVGAGVVAIVILVALLVIIRKLNKKDKTKQ